MFYFRIIIKCNKRGAASKGDFYKQFVVVLFLFLYKYRRVLVFFMRENLREECGIVWLCMLRCQLNTISVLHFISLKYFNDISNKLQAFRTTLTLRADLNSGVVCYMLLFWRYRLGGDICRHMLIVRTYSSYINNI